MSTFFMFGKYSPKALQEISKERTDKVIDAIKTFDGQVHSMYAVLGEYDLIFIVDFPDSEKAMLASVALGRFTGISFTTSAAMNVDEFDRMTVNL